MTSAIVNAYTSALMRKRPAAPVTPVRLSSSIDAAGTTLTDVYSVAVSVGSGGGGGNTISATGGSATITLASGAGTATWTWTISRAIQSGETVTRAYTQPGNGIESTAAGVDLASYTGAAVANGSSQGASGSSIPTAYDTLYAGGWAANTGTDAKTLPTQARPAKISGDILSGGYRDQRFDVEVRRITALADSPDTVTNMRHFYSRRQPVNDTLTRYIAKAGNGWWYLYNRATGATINGGRTLTPGLGALNGPADQCELMWHPTDPTKLWYTSNLGGLIWYEFDTATNVSTTLFNLGPLLSALGWTTVTKTWTKNEGVPSFDGRYWCLIGSNSADVPQLVFTYDRQTNTILGTLSLAGAYVPDHVSMSPLGSRAVISWYGTAAATLSAAAAQPLSVGPGARAYTLDFSSFTQLAVLGEHSDLGLDYAGNEVFVMVTFHGSADGVTDGSILVRNVVTGAVYELPFNAFAGTTGTAFHISCQSTRKRPGYAVVGKYAGVGAGAYDGVICISELKPGAVVRRLAHHRTTASPYEAEPHGVGDPWLTSVTWVSNWDGGAAIEDYSALLPSWTLPVLGAPEALTAPAVSGTATPGGVLNRTLGTYGGVGTITVTGNWQVDSGSGFGDVAGATGASYTIPGGAANGTLYRWRETAVNAIGNATANSNTATVAALSAPSNTVPPTAPGSGSIAVALSGAAAGTWTGNPVPSLVYQWQRDISGAWTDVSNGSGNANVTTLTPTFATPGSYRLKVTGTNTQGSAVGYSGAAAVVDPDAQPDLTRVFDFTTGTTGQTLAAIDAGWSVGGSGYTRTAGSPSTLQGNGSGYNSPVALYSVATTADQAFEISCAAQSDLSGFEDWSGYLRCNDAGTVYYRIQVTTAATSGTVYIYKNGTDLGVDGVGTPGTRPTFPASLRTTDAVLRASVVAGRIRVYANDVLVADYSDATPIATGKPGIYMYQNGNNARVRFKSFKCSN